MGDRRIVSIFSFYNRPYASRLVTNPLISHLPYHKRRRQRSRGKISHVDVPSERTLKNGKNGRTGLPFIFWLLGKVDGGEELPNKPQNAIFH